MVQMAGPHFSSTREHIFNAPIFHNFVNMIQKEKN